MGTDEHRCPILEWRRIHPASDVDLHTESNRGSIGFDRRLDLKRSMNQWERVIGLKFLLFAAAITPALAGEPVFVGMLNSRETGTLYAISPSEGSAVRWLKLGDAVDGYVVTTYRPSDDSLVLTKAGHTYTVRLKDAKVRQGQDPLELIVLAAAKKIILRMEHWDTDVTYQVAQVADGHWYVFASKQVDGKPQLRRVRLTHEGKATNFSVLSSPAEK